METQPFIELLSNMKKKKKVYILDPDRFYKAKSGTHSFVKVFRRKKEETRLSQLSSNSPFRRGRGHRGQSEHQGRHGQQRQGRRWSRE
jgi:hypothetical protein